MQSTASQITQFSQHRLSTPLVGCDVHMVPFNHPVSHLVCIFCLKQKSTAPNYYHVKNGYLLENRSMEQQMVYLEEPVHTRFPCLDDIYYSFMLKEDRTRSVFTKLLQCKCISMQVQPFITVISVITR